MTDFPTLAVTATAYSFSEKSNIDPTIRSDFENGAILTRSKFKNNTLTWTVKYDFLTNSDKELLDDFQNNTVKWGAGAFNWINPEDNITYEVRLNTVINFIIVSKTNREWSAQFEVVQTRPTNNINLS